MTMPRAIVFDCDGVLFESKGANLTYYNRILGEFDVPPVCAEDAERAHICHTAASAVVLASLMPEELLEQALSFLETLDYREFIPFMTPFSGMIEGLEALSRQFPLAMATNRGRSVSHVLQDFDIARYFSVVVSSRDVPRPKPYPDMLYHAAERLAVLPGELLFIGDSELDWQAARAAEVPFVGFGRSFEGSARVTSHDELVARILDGTTSAS